MLAQAIEIPWKELIGGGSVGVALLMCWLFLKHQTEMRKEHNATIEKVTQQNGDVIKQVTTDFSTTVRNNSEKFNDTTQMILRDSREREDKLHAIIHKERGSQ